MLESAALFAAFEANGVSFYTGVPDSTLTDFCACVADHAGEGKHVIAVNEGCGVALAAGHHLATGDVTLVYMQNSGQGNAVNPLVSLADPAVYGIPMVLLIGWRGEPGRSDEPQHAKQGRITLPMLDALDIPYETLPTSEDAAAETVARAVSNARRISGPSCIVVRRGSFARYRVGGEQACDLTLSRERAIRILADHLDPAAAIVSTTGKASRELFEHRVACADDSGRDFLTVGSMGHASQIALGVALACRGRQVCCIDGDGAVLMHMGSLATIGSLQPENFMHAVINNGCHESVGGQPTVGFLVDIPVIAAACGYRHVARVQTAEQLTAELDRNRGLKGPTLLEIRVRRGARADLGRPTDSPSQTKTRFVRFLRS